MKRLLLSIALIIMAVVFGFAEGDSPKWTAPARAAAKKNPIPGNETSIALGKKIYERQCLACHGPSGKGDGRIAAKLEKRPGNLSDPKLWEQNDGALFWKVNEGHRPMPTFKNVMSDEERWPVINYIRTLAAKPSTSDHARKKPNHETYHRNSNHLRLRGSSYRSCNYSRQLGSSSPRVREKESSRV